MLGNVTCVLECFSSKLPAWWDERRTALFSTRPLKQDNMVLSSGPTQAQEECILSVSFPTRLVSSSLQNVSLFNALDDGQTLINLVLIS